MTKSHFLNLQFYINDLEDIYFQHVSKATKKITTFPPSTNSIIYVFTSLQTYHWMRGKYWIAAMLILVRFAQQYHIPIVVLYHCHLTVWRYDV